MRTLLKNGTVLNVFTDELEKTNVLIEDDNIIGVGEYNDAEAECSIDVSGKILCPGFIDSHIHIESTMLTPGELARVCVPHGTTAIVADPHEIANVCGRIGLGFMIQAAKNLPVKIYFMLPSCVPATEFDESGAVLDAEDIKNYYGYDEVLGLAEMMNYPGVLAKQSNVLEKIADARNAGKIINGHAPLLTGKDLDAYIAAGISDDHECTSAEEAKERIRKGQKVMIRQGTAARNLQGLLPLFEEPWASKCMLVTDDKHPADLLKNGHIDSIIREAVKNGKSVITGIKMATIQAATHYGLRDVGAIAAGYQADILVLDDLDNVKVRDVWKCGELVVKNGEVVPFEKPWIDDDIWKAVRNSFFMKEVHPKDLMVEPKGHLCRVIRVIPKELITEEEQIELEFNKCNGIDIEEDILKIAVIERHMKTGHIGLGYIKGVGMKTGAIASSVSHDSHNLIVIGTNEEDMATVANHIRAIGGGLAVCENGEIKAELPLPLGGLMSREDAACVASMNEEVRVAAKRLGYNQGIEPFMNMAFVSLPVIPHIKLTTKGLVDVDKQEIVELFIED